MKIDTTRFGVLEVPEEEVVEFSRGLFGFEDIDRYVLLDHRPGSPFRWLQAVGRPDLAFVVMDPREFCSHYDFDIPEEDGLVLKSSDGEGLQVLVVVGIPDDPVEMTANLKGPILINAVRRIGRQIVLPGDQYSPRFRIVDGIRMAKDRTAVSE
ncbi:MAG: flagellar assembly protein FliW [Candidatus Eisenbacteria sp.]|nr:flagellar assembly protein FliW [Candidatus Eisenbacteria bacterium]